MEKDKRIFYITEITKYCIEKGLSLEMSQNSDKTIFEIHKDKIKIEFNEKDNKIDYLLKMNLEYLKTT